MIGVLFFIFSIIIIFTAHDVMGHGLVTSLSTIFMIQEPNFRPRTFCVTGATDGIGKHTSQKLASDGHAVLLHGRKPIDDPSVKTLIRDLQSRGAVRVGYLQADLSDLSQVENLAKCIEDELRQWQQAKGTIHPVTPSLDVLINNAGVFDPANRYSAQGFDSTIAVNVIAPFVLTRKLLPCILRGNNPRIITTSSISQSSTLPDVNRLFARRLEGEDEKFDFEPIPYSAHSLYSHSKLCDLMFTAHLARLLSAYEFDVENSYQDMLLNNMRGIQCLTMDPGTVNTKMLLAGWGPCGIPVSKANNTFKLATSDDYSRGRVESGSYHFGFRQSSDAVDETKMRILWSKLTESTGCDYNNLSDCF